MFFCLVWFGFVQSGAITPDWTKPNQTKQKTVCINVRILKYGPLSMVMSDGEPILTPCLVIYDQQWLANECKQVLGLSVMTDPARDTCWFKIKDKFGHFYV